MCITSVEEARTEVERAEQVQLKACVVKLEEDFVTGGKLAMVILGEDGKAVSNLAAKLRKGKRGGRWTSMVQGAWRAIVVVSSKPWVQKATEKMLWNLLSSWGKRHCKTE